MVASAPRITIPTLPVKWLLLSLVGLMTAPARMLIYWRGPGRLPQRHQLLYIQPADVKFKAKLYSLSVGRLGDIGGRIIFPGDWDLNLRSVVDRKHSVLVGLAQGQGPIESGYVDWMESKIVGSEGFHGCRTRDDIMKRARQLEELIAELARCGRLYERRELEKWAFRERGGIQVAIGRSGQLIFASHGNHRLIFSQALNLAAIPVSIAAVHPQAVRSGAWDRLVRASRQLAEQAPASGGAR